MRALRRWFASLLVRQALLVLLPLLLILGGTVWGGLRTLDVAITENVRSSIGKTALILNMTVAAYIGNGDLKTLALFFGEMLNDADNNGLVYVLVGRENGEVLMDSRGIGEPVPLPDDADDWERRALAGLVHVRSRLLLSGKEIGFLQFGVATTEMVSAIRAEQRQILLFNGGVALLTLLVAGALGWRASRRLAELIGASKDVAYGQYQRRIADHGEDELAQLADHFNRMAQAVEAKLAEITALNEGLEQRVSERTVALAQANQQLQDNLQQLSDAKDQIVRSEKLAGLGALVAGVAHELNTPIGNAMTVGTTMLEHAQQLEKLFRDGSLRKSEMQSFVAQFSHGCEILTRNLERANELISSFKTVAVDRASEQRRRFNLQQIVQQLATSLQPSIRRTPYALETEVPPDIEFDSYPGPLNQVLTNLINNGLAHAFEARSEGSMRLSAHIDPASPDWVSIEFSDNGIGIPAEHLSQIFDPFFTTKLGQGGSGLGLNISHNIVEGVLGGRLKVKSRVGEGTTFILRLPLKAPHYDSARNSR